MATTSTATAFAAIELVSTGSERLALAGFLAGYTGLTREAYALDLRQYASWCQQRLLRIAVGRLTGHAAGQPVGETAVAHELQPQRSLPERNT